MTAEEMREKFDELYGIMATSNNPKYMRVFGETMRRMMSWAIDNDATAAKDFLDELCAIKWDNYLTDKEALNVVSAMQPKAVWTKEQWADALDKLGIAHEEPPHYNCNALYAVMSMEYSDSAATIAKLMGKPLAGVSNEDLLKATHALSLDKLKDDDKRFNVRTYFGL